MKRKSVDGCVAGSLFAIAMATAVPGGAQGWGLGDMVQQNMAFDQQFNNQLYGAMANVYQQQQQLLQSYIQMQGEKLWQEYQAYVQQTGAQIPFEQYAYYHMITMGGRNAAPALQQQQRSFEALQDANRTLQQGYDSYNQGWWNNTQTMDRAAGRYSNEAIRGNAWYRNPETGEMQNLPYGYGPAYYHQGTGWGYYQDPAGDYYQLGPQGYGVPMEQVDPDFGD